MLILQTLNCRCRLRGWLSWGVWQLERRMVSGLEVSWGLYACMHGEGRTDWHACSGYCWAIKGSGWLQQEAKARSSDMMQVPAQDHFTNFLVDGSLWAMSYSCLETRYWYATSCLYPCLSGHRAPLMSRPLYRIKHACHALCDASDYAVRSYIYVCESDRRS